MDKVRVFYLRDRNKFPVACVASTLSEEDKITYALSIHNPKDTFDRVRGRDIAKARLAKGRFHGVVPKVEGAKLAVLANLVGDLSLPKRVREAAAYHLVAGYREAEGGATD